MNHIKIYHHITLYSELMIKTILSFFDVYTLHSKDNFNE